MISLFISVVVVGLIVWLLLWALGEFGIPEPFNKVARVIIILFAIVWILNLLLPLVGVKL